MTSKRKQFGVAAVELALILPVLVLITFGTYEFGRNMSYYNTMVKSVRDGARHLTLYAPGDNAKIIEAKCLVVYANTSCDDANDTPLVPGLKTTDVQVQDKISDPLTHYQQQIIDPTDSAKIIGVANLVTIRITSYTFNLPVGNFFGPDLFSFTSKPISETMIQVL